MHEPRKEGGRGELEQAAITGRIIGAAIAVHTALGPGFLESIYEAALAIELSRREVPFARQVEVPVLYGDERVGLHRLDLLVADAIVVELKHVAQFRIEHFAVVRSYLKATRLEHGLLLNFGTPTLAVKRVAIRLHA